MHLYTYFCEAVKSNFKEKRNENKAQTNNWNSPCWSMLKGRIPLLHVYIIFASATTMQLIFLFMRLI